MNIIFHIYFIALFIIENKLKIKNIKKKFLTELIHINKNKFIFIIIKF